MSASNANLTVNLVNNCAGGYITFNGFPTTYSPDPVEHGAPPLILPTVKNDGNTYAIFQVSDGFNDPDVEQTDGETQGDAYFNMPDGSILDISWHLYFHPDTNNDDGYQNITCPNYTIQYLQSDGVSYDTAVYWSVTNVNTFKATISITEYYN
jgi:hypothetical protein